METLPVRWRLRSPAETKRRGEEGRGGNKVKHGAGREGYKKRFRPSEKRTVMEGARTRKHARTKIEDRTSNNKGINNTKTKTKTTNNTNTSISTPTPTPRARLYLTRLRDRRENVRVGDGVGVRRCREKRPPLDGQPDQPQRPGRLVAGAH